MTSEDITSYYNLVVFAAHMTTNATVPRVFLSYVQAGESELQANVRVSAKYFSSDHGGSAEGANRTNSELITGKKSQTGFLSAAASGNVARSFLSNDHRQKHQNLMVTGHVYHNWHGQGQNMEVMELSHQKIRYSDTGATATHNHHREKLGSFKIVGDHLQLTRQEVTASKFISTPISFMVKRYALT